MGRIVGIILTAFGALLIPAGIFISAQDQSTGISLIVTGIAQILVGIYLIDLIENLEAQINRSFHSSAFLKLIAYNMIDNPVNLRKILDHDPAILTRSEIDIFEDCLAEIKQAETLPEKSDE